MSRDGGHEVSHLLFLIATKLINVMQHHNPDSNSKSGKREVNDKQSAASLPRKRPRPSNSMPSFNVKASQRPYKVPILQAADDGCFSWGDFLREYTLHRVVLLKSFQETRSFGLRDVSDIFARSASAKKTWCQENMSQMRAKTNWLDPKNQRAGDRWYASFILQEDQKLLANVLESLPLSELTQQDTHFAKTSTDTKSTWLHTNSVWFFVGSNTHLDNTCMKGRKEHTDAISHDGTW